MPIDQTEENQPMSDNELPVVDDAGIEALIHKLDNKNIGQTWRDAFLRAYPRALEEIGRLKGLEEGSKMLDIIDENIEMKRCAMWFNTIPDFHNPAFPQWMKDGMLAAAQAAWLFVRQNPDLFKGEQYVAPTD